MKKIGEDGMERIKENDEWKDLDEIGDMLVKGKKGKNVNDIRDILIKV